LSDRFDFENWDLNLKFVSIFQISKWSFCTYLQNYKRSPTCYVLCQEHMIICKDVASQNVGKKAALKPARCLSQTSPTVHKHWTSLKTIAKSGPPVSRMRFPHLRHNFFHTSRPYTTIWLYLNNYFAPTLVFKLYSSLKSMFQFSCEATIITLMCVFYIIQNPSVIYQVYFPNLD